MRTGLALRAHAWLERALPDRRIFLKSKDETRFVRLGPEAQLAAWFGGSVSVAWLIIATALLLMDSVGSGNLRDRAEREQAIYEARLEAMARQRDLAAGEAAQAQARYEAALEQVSAMQSALLAAEGRTFELEDGMVAIQATLRRFREERDEARGEADSLVAQLGGDAAKPMSHEALALITAALEMTAEERDAATAAADAALEETERLGNEIALMEQRNERIFAQLEEAVTVSITPLEKMFRAAGLPPDRIIREIRAGYSGQGGPLTPIISTRGAGMPDPLADRANAILSDMGEIDLYRLAAAKLPFANPIPSGSYRQTSAFGPRRDPIRGGRRMHNGLDFAGKTGTPIHATADGVVVKAGWSSGYGRMVEIQHAHGVVTRYAHNSKLYVKKGQRVSRGDRIAGMGSTGRSTGTHLHYEVHSGGKPVDPMIYIRAARNVF